VVVWIHGGGWVRGSLDTVDPVCRALVNEVGCAVVSVGYRLAPEHPFPVGLEDCYAALEWVETNPEIVLGDPDRIAVGGTSAGGNLAVAVALLARDREGPAIAHQVPFVPVLDRPRATRSYEENATGYGLSRADMEWYWSHYVGAETDAGNRYAAPLQARDLSRLPPATIVTAGNDPIRDDGIEYADRLRATGADVEHHHYPDMPHGIASAAYYHEDVGRTREAFGAVADSLRDALET
jgi:acetyl esterase